MLKMHKLVRKGPKPAVNESSSCTAIAIVNRYIVSTIKVWCLPRISPTTVQTSFTGITRVTTIILRTNSRKKWIVTGDISQMLVFSFK